MTAVRFGNPTMPQGSSSPRSLHPLEVRVRIQSLRATPVRLAADVSDELGNKLVNADTGKLPQEFVNVPQRTSEWRLDIESIYVQPGSYLIDLWLANPRGDTLEFRPMAVRMDVLDVDGQPPDPTTAAQTDGLVARRFSVSRSDADNQLRRAR